MQVDVEVGRRGQHHDDVRPEPPRLLPHAAASSRQDDVGGNLRVARRDGAAEIVAQHGADIGSREHLLDGAADLVGAALIQRQRRDGVHRIASVLKLAAQAAGEAVARLLPGDLAAERLLERVQRLIGQAALGGKRRGEREGIFSASAPITLLAGPRSADTVLAASSMRLKRESSRAPA